MLDGCLYVGSSADLNQRYIDHHQNHRSNTTATFGAGEMLFYEAHDNCIEAEIRERQIKKWSKAKKLALADGDEEPLKTLSKRRFI
jgi:predicted GIY-YIG superfamily endonuclease